MLLKSFEEMGIAFDFSNKFTVARVPYSYADAEDFALHLVYSLKPYVAKKRGVGDAEVVLIAISKNNKVVVASNNEWPRNHLYKHFKKPSLGYAQFYDNVDPELIIEKIKDLYK